MFKLRPYQTDLINKTRDALRTHNSVLITAPTGSGKTALSAFMLGTATRKAKRSFFICHRIELLEQTARTFDLVNIPYGFIAAGLSPDPYQPVQICSVDTLRSRLEKISPPDFCIWDEAHHTASESWSRIHARYPRAKHVGLTATPQRLDGKGLGQWFSALIAGPSVATLIKEGYLVDYKAYAPGAPDLSGIHTRAGDYAKDELQEAMDKNTITGDAIQHYLRLARGKRAVVFCVSVKHSEHVAEQFRYAGIMAAHIDGQMDRKDRKTAIDGFRAGTIQVITNVEIIHEGFDLPAIEAVILLRPTQSLSFYLQMVGRALRPGKPHAIILDHTGNIMRHGLPDDEREWSLEGTKKKDKKNTEENIPIRQCPMCFAVHRPMPICPRCGHVYAIQYREFKQVEGELTEIDKEKLRRAQRHEQGRAQSLADLVRLAKARGYRNPHAWAGYVWTSRQAKKEVTR